MNALQIYTDALINQNCFMGTYAKRTGWILCNRAYLQITRLLHMGLKIEWIDQSHSIGLRNEEHKTLTYLKSIAAVEGSV